MTTFTEFARAVFDLGCGAVLIAAAAWLLTGLVGLLMGKP